MARRTDLRALVGGKQVAIVGRAGSIAGTGNGKLIDGFDVVIRINWVLPIPDEQKADVGSRTDLVYHCRRAKTAKAEATRLGVETYRVSGKLRKREARNHFRRHKVYRPTTGFTCIIETLRAGATKVGLYGFDVFRSGHIQEREPEGDSYDRPLKWAHNPEEERKALKRIVRKNEKVFPDKVLREALK